LTILDGGKSGIDGGQPNPWRAFGQAAQSNAAPTKKPANAFWRPPGPPWLRRAPRSGARDLLNTQDLEKSLAFLVLFERIILSSLLN